MPLYPDACAPLRIKGEARDWYTFTFPPHTSHRLENTTTFSTTLPYPWPHPDHTTPTPFSRDSGTTSALSTPAGTRASGYTQAYPLPHSPIPDPWPLWILLSSPHPCTPFRTLIPFIPLGGCIGGRVVSGTSIGG